MEIINNNLGMKCLGFFLMIFISTNKTVACPCFNNVFLEITFNNSKSTKCVVYQTQNLALRNKNYVYKAEISDEKHITSSTHSECLLNTAKHDVYMNFTDNDSTIDNIEDHHECIDAILDACKNLSIGTLNK